MTTSVPSRAFPGQPPPVFEAGGGLLADAPALSRPDWLPPEAEGFPELDELRAEQLRLREAAGEAAVEIAALRERFEREDAAHAEAARAQALGQGVKLPKLTSPEERAAALAEPEARAKAVHELREQLVGRAVETISERYDEWAQVLDSRDGAAEARVAEARRGARGGGGRAWRDDAASRLAGADRRAAPALDQQAVPARRLRRPRGRRRGGERAARARHRGGRGRGLPAA